MLQLTSYDQLTIRKFPTQASYLKAQRISMHVYCPGLRVTYLASVLNNIKVITMLLFMLIYIASLTPSCPYSLCNFHNRVGTVISAHRQLQSIIGAQVQETKEKREELIFLLE